MAVDPNVYALSIQLQLDSTDAFSSLEEFSQAATNVEESVSTAAQNSINAISGLIDNLNQQLSQAVITTGQFADATSDVEGKLVSTASSLKDAYDIEKDSLRDLIERREHMEKIDDIQSNIEKSIENEQKTGQEYLGTINRWVEALEGKNLIHDEEAGMIKHEQKLVGDLDGKWGKIKEKQVDSNKVLAKIVASMGTIWAIIKNFDKETENFVTANYRVYGSQQKLVQNTRQLSAEYGIFREEAIATYKALADVKTPREEIYKLSKTVARANRVTGLGIDTLAEYSFRLRGSGFDAERTRKQIDMLSAAQRKFGLSTYDVQKAIESQTLSVGQQIMHFGKDAPEAFMKASLGLKALDKELGSNAAEDWMERLQLSGVEGMVFWQKFGIDASATIGEKFEGMTKVVQTAADRIGVSMEQIAAGDLTDYQRAELKLLGKAYNITEEMIYSNARAYSELTDEQKRNMMTMEGISEAFKTQLDADKRWQESMATLTAQLNRLKAAINGVIGWLVQMVADALIPVLYVLNFVIQVIGVFIGMIRSTIGWMEEWIPGFSILMKVVRFIAGAIIGLILVLVAAGTALAAFGFAFGSVSTIVQGGLDIIRGVGRAILSIARAIGASLKAIFTGLGQGLAALGSSVKPVIVPLMQLGVAVLLVGAGFWLMGMGLKAAAEHGWAAFGMLVAMTWAMIAMITVFAIIATIAAPAIPLIVALAAAVAILGYAALLAGLGMYLMGLTIEQIAEFGLQAAAALPSLATGMLAIGAAGLVSFPGILLAAGALIALGVALWLIATPLAMISAAIEGLTSDALNEFADALLASSWKITLALFALLPALVILPLIAAGLLLAGVTLIVAGALFAVASVIIGFGAKLLGEGMSAIAVGAKDFKDVDFIAMAYQLLVGGLILLAAGLPFVLGATLVGIGALLLGYGLQSLGDGAKTLDGIDFVSIAQQLAMGAVWLLVGGSAFAIAAGLIGFAALLLGVGLWMLGKGAKTLEGIDFAAMSKQLAIGGFWLAIGAAAFVVGATAVGAAAIVLGIGLALLSWGAGALEDIDFVGMATKLYEGSAWLGLAAIGMLWAGPQLITAAWILLVAGLVLMAAAASLFISGNWLVPAAISIYVGMSWLETAVQRFKRSVSNIGKMGKSMQTFASSFRMLRDAPIGSIGDAADAALDAMPNVDKLARQLDKSAGLFQAAADKFVKPVREISESLNELGGALANIGTQGMMVQDDMDKLGGMLEKYTDLLEGTAQRIELAVATKAQPAMAAAREEGLEDAVRSEAITTVQVMDKTEGDAERADETVLMMQEQTTLLRNINDKMGVMGEGGGTELTTIVDLLERYLPGITNKEEGLTTEFNQWMK